MIFYTKKVENVNTIVYYANETNNRSHNKNLISSKNFNVETNVYHAKTKLNIEKNETQRRKYKFCFKFFEFDNKFYEYIRRKHDNKQLKKNRNRRFTSCRCRY